MFCGFEFNKLEFTYCFWVYYVFSGTRGLVYGVMGRPEGSGGVMWLCSVNPFKISNEIRTFCQKVILTTQLLPSLNDYVSSF